MQHQLVHIPAAPPFPNSALPLIIYPKAMPAETVSASGFQALFARHGWPGAWVNGVYRFHHFHAQAHEVLGCARGWVKVLLGGPEGQAFVLEAGDAALLPAGLAHFNVEASADYQIVGSYPRGQSPDLERGDPQRYQLALADISRVPLPLTDPVFGPNGPVISAWASVAR